MKNTLLLLCCPALLWAADYQSDNTPDDRIIEKTEQWTHLAVSSPAMIAPMAEKTTTEWDENTLLAKPALLKRAMQSVLLTKHIDGIRVILPIYQQLPDADTLLITYAKSLLAHSQGQLKTAIDGYRKIIAEQPQLSAVRLDLAIALYANRQSVAARDQLARLQSQALPDKVSQLVQQTIRRIDRETDWQFNADFYYRSEDNINNVPEQRQIAFGSGTLTFDEPEKAHGLHFALGAKKRFNLSHHRYLNMQLNTVGDYFWDKHDYDDLSLRAGIGFGYQDAKITAEIQPFAKKRFYGTQPYSLTSGATGTFSYRLTPRWKLSKVIEWSYEDYNQREHLNGQRQFIGLSVDYIHNPQQYWSAGINYYNNEAKGRENSYHRTGAFIGWRQEWQYGISSNLTLSAGKRNYDGVDFFNIQRTDKEYSAKLSLWHRSVHYWGITPRLVWSWHKTDSNHFYYSRKENTLNIAFSKAF